MDMTKDEIMMESLMNFFQYSHNFEILKEFLPKNNKNKISRRIVNWFVTNYAKQYNTAYIIEKPNSKPYIFEVYYEYVAAMNGYNKYYFDPFCRKGKDSKVFDLESDDGIQLTTTIAQLNFFRWAIRKGVIEYVRLYSDEIYDDMTRRTNTKDGRKKKQLSIDSGRTLASIDSKRNDLPSIKVE